MGLLPCHLSCHRDDESQSGSNHLHSESSNSSISSPSSLQSVPSLTPVSQHDQTPTIHHKCIATLKVNSYVFSLALARKVLYSGSSNGEIRAWSQDFSEQDNPTDNIVATSNTAVKSLVVLGDKLFSAHQDNKVRIWKIHNHLQQKYKCIATLPTLNDRFLRCFSKKNYVQVRRHRKSIWVHHVDAVSALAISIDCSLLYSASWDRTFKVWRTSDFKCLESVQNAHDDAINAIVLAKDGFVYTGSADKTFKVWKKHAGENKHLLLATLEKHKSAVNALALNNDGTVLYSGACDRSILVWERECSAKGGGNRHMVLVGALKGHTKAILCLAVVMDLICSGSADKTVRIWRRGTDKSYSCLAVLEGHRRPVKCLTAAVDGNTNTAGASEPGTTYMVCSGSLDYDIKVWQVWAPLF
ncbi:protein JINGUBANG [Herrania umbratica]|uniref:Protein JINGUBANG n=1 Tax=Herrania umbratica TaxID=108875 RepID=A0A6J1B3F5_9ROSI|nr:protein JINGUBANG [Herrania umbratica]